jgi:hypothetical protein
MHPSRIRTAAFSVGRSPSSGDSPVVSKSITTTGSNPQPPSILQEMRSLRRGVGRRRHRHIPPLPPPLRDPFQCRDPGVERRQRGDPNPATARVHTTPTGDQVLGTEQVLFQDDPVIASLIGIDPALPNRRVHRHLDPFEILPYGALSISPTGISAHMPLPELSHKREPKRFPNMSPQMGGILGYLLEHT